MQVEKFNSIVIIPSKTSLQDIEMMQREQSLFSILWSSTHRSTGVASARVGSPCSFFRQSLQGLNSPLPVNYIKHHRVSALRWTVGETPFQSKITGNCEYLPVAISLLASPGVYRHLYSRPIDNLTSCRARSRTFQVGSRMSREIW